MKSKTKKRVACYARSAVRNKQNIRNQLAVIQDFVDENREYEFHDFYIDDGISGITSLFKRPTGSRLLKDAIKGKFDVILVTRFDRIGRDIKNVIESLNKLSELDIGFKSVLEQYETETPEGRLGINILKAFIECGERNLLNNNKPDE